jgi:hypothetical protein
MKVVYRSQWGARPPIAKTPLSPAAIDALVGHYSAFDGDEQKLHRNCPGRVRAIQNFHMDTRGWSDIAYNWLFCIHGVIFQGRGWGIRSAATGDANSHTVAACFLGNDSAGQQDLTPEAKDAFRSIYEFVKKRTPQDITCKGHRDFMATSCPGDELYRFLRTLRREA